MGAVWWVERDRKMILRTVVEMRVCKCDSDVGRESWVIRSVSGKSRLWGKKNISIHVPYHGTRVPIPEPLEVKAFRQRCLHAGSIHDAGRRQITSNTKLYQCQLMQTSRIKTANDLFPKYPSPRWKHLFQRVLEDTHIVINKGLSISWTIFSH